ncbi:MAG TPA: CHAT domain-containing protein, partial [Blastocatellia bacterium]|nr:CHAT domain-containing protein [Blastocatellia bacterium]
DLYDRITRRDPQGDDTQRFGSYLFDTLVGRAAWEVMVNAAGEAGEKMMELALSWPKNENDLHRLNWEMMYHPTQGRFFAAGLLDPPLDLAITRVVTGTGGVLWKARQAGSPPRVLFVIGTAETEASIRPGAEYVGLLRQLNYDGRSIHSRVLQQASPALIEHEIKRFHPDVVHFICHGDINPGNGRGYLVLATENQERGTGAGDPYYADQLINFLRVEGSCPPMVVLSACFSAGDNTGRMLGAHQAAPLAAELVAGGVPIVIGMAGRVSDRGCRLFTTSFGQTLLQGSPVVRAATEARWAAFYQVDAQKTVDWAFPTIFMAEAVDPAYVPVNVSENDLSLEIKKRIKAYDLNRDPVFCGRNEFFDAFYELFERGDDRKSVMAIYTNKPAPRLGRTRLLQELAAQALRDAHVPCMICSDQADWEPGIKHSGQLAVELLRAIANARKAFKLDLPFDSILLRLLSQKKPIDIRRLQESYPPAIAFSELVKHFDKFDKELALATDSLKEAISIDLARLAEDARQKHECTKKMNGRVLVFLDDVHQYDEAATDLFNSLLGPFGLGTDDEPAPVILTFSKGTAADHYLTPMLEKRSSKPWLNLKQLEPLRPDGEDLIACGQVLMHPFKREMRPGISDRPWAVNDAFKNKQYAAALELMFRSSFEGIPDLLFEGRIYIPVDGARRMDYLIDANDEAVMEAMKQRRGQ